MQTMSKLLLLMVVMTPGMPAVATEQKANAPVAASSQGHELVAGMDVIIAKDGSITSVAPSSTLPEPLRQLLIKRVSQWRYEVPMWQGKPAQVPARLVLRLLAVPTTSGGFVMRVVRRSWDDESDPGSGTKLPQYPLAANKRGVGGSFVYMQRVDIDGSVLALERKYPIDVSDRFTKVMDEAAQESFRTSLLRPIIVNGAAVVCERLAMITFTPPGSPVSKKLDLDSKPFHDALQDRCPTVLLSTKIENTLL